MTVRSLVAVVLFAHGILLAWSAVCHSPVFCEVGCLPAGLSHLHYGRFDLYRVNPPMVRTIAAFPAACNGAVVDWKGYSLAPFSRPWNDMGFAFLKANGSSSLWYFTFGRWMCIPFSLLGGYVCFAWGCRLYGEAGGTLAMMLWCFCPYVLGHAALVTPDAHAAAMGVAASYAFWRWLRGPCWTHAVLAGLVLGLAELCKFTLLVFYPLWIAIWMFYRLPGDRQMGSQRHWLEVLQISTIVALSVLVINLGYGFEGSFQRLRDYRFQSRTLTGADSLADVPVEGGNRFEANWWGVFPVPLPKNFLQGIDTQKVDFERGFDSYLRGTWKKGGWWYYYLYALAIKIPLGVWILLLLAIGASVLASGYRLPWRDELCLALPAVTFLVVVSSQTGFSIHSRYILPMLPFVYLWIGRLGRCVRLRHWKLAGATGAAVFWSVASSLGCYPHSLSYFNELVGGPMKGHDHLLDSNIAWGQDLFFLKDWLAAHPEASPLHLATIGWVDPALAEIEFVLPPLGPDPANQNRDPEAPSLGPQPGWYAIDVNHLHSTEDWVVDECGELHRLASETLNYRYFLQFEPVATAGYSIYIYHITLEDANRVRRRLGLPELKEQSDAFEAPPSFPGQRSP